MRLALHFCAPILRAFSTIQSVDEGIFPFTSGPIVATLSSDTPQLRGIRALTSATTVSSTRIICLYRTLVSLADPITGHCHFPCNQPGGEIALPRRRCARLFVLAWISLSILLEDGI